MDTDTVLLGLFIVAGIVGAATWLWRLAREQSLAQLDQTDDRS